MRPILLKKDLVLPWDPRASEKLYDFHSDWYFKSYKHICAEGPRACGKSVSSWILILEMIETTPGLKVLILRPKFKQIRRTTHKTLIDRVLAVHWSSPKQPMHVRGRDTDPDTIIFENGAEILYGGLDDSSKYQGFEADVIFINEVTTLKKPDEFSNLLAPTAGGRGGNLRGKDGRKRSLIITDCNPEENEHWYYDLYLDTGDPSIKTYSFVHEDNPIYYDHKIDEKTELYDEMLEDLLRAYPPGHLRDRMVYGIRAAAQGAVFRIIDDVHLVDEFPENYDRWDKYRMMDFGMDDPTTCLWLGHDRGRTNDIFVHREIARTHANIIDFGHEVKNITALSNEQIKVTIIDNDENRFQLLQRECGIQCQMARKGPGSIQDGIQLIQHGLYNAEIGKPGALRIYKNLLYSGITDPEYRGKKDLIGELKGMRFDPDRPGEVIDGNDHRVDPLRYWFLWFHAGLLKSHEGAPLDLTQLNA